MKARFFATPSEFRAWLQQHHGQIQELWVGFHKKNSGKPSITWPEAVDQALCFGWIDGLRKSLDSKSYVIRFTPRKPRSTWSAVNIARAKELAAQGLMSEAGLKNSRNARTKNQPSIPMRKGNLQSLRIPRNSNFVPTREPGASFRASLRGTEGQVFTG
jgi:uncharacterized protein YdeI (YjbR/CyaY-like superfamily)